MSSFSVEQATCSLRRISKLSLERLGALAVLAYFSGWQYVNAYFSYFNVNRSSYAIDDYTVFLYFFYVIVTLPNVLISGSVQSIVAVLLLALAFFLSAIKFRGAPHRLLNSLRLALLLAAAFGALYLFSIEAGTRAAHDVARGRARAVEVTLTPAFWYAYATHHSTDHKQALKDDLSRANNNDALAVVWRNNDETLILQYDDTAGTSHGNPIGVYRISNDFISLIQTKWRAQ